jgi:hypothetical protein
MRKCDKEWYFNLGIRGSNAAIQKWLEIKFTDKGNVNFDAHELARYHLNSRRQETSDLKSSYNPHLTFKDGSIVRLFSQLPFPSRKGKKDEWGFNRSPRSYSVSRSDVDPDEYSNGDPLIQQPKLLRESKHGISTIQQHDSDYGLVFTGALVAGRSRIVDQILEHIERKDRMRFSSASAFHSFTSPPRSPIHTSPRFPAHSPSPRLFLQSSYVGSSLYPPTLSLNRAACPKESTLNMISPINAFSGRKLDRSSPPSTKKYSWSPAYLTLSVSPPTSRLPPEPPRKKLADRRYNVKTRGYMSTYFPSKLYIEYLVDRLILEDDVRGTLALIAFIFPHFRHCYTNMFLSFECVAGSKGKRNRSKSPHKESGTGEYSPRLTHFLDTLPSSNLMFLLENGSPPFGDKLIYGLSNLYSEERNYNLPSISADVSLDYLLCVLDLVSRRVSLDSQMGKLLCKILSDDVDSIRDGNIVKESISSYQDLSRLRSIFKLLPFASLAK